MISIWYISKDTKYIACSLMNTCMVHYYITQPFNQLGSMTFLWWISLQPLAALGWRLPTVSTHIVDRSFGQCLGYWKRGAARARCGGEVRKRRWISHFSMHFLRAFCRNTSGSESIHPPHSTSSNCCMLMRRFPRGQTWPKRLFWRFRNLAKKRLKYTIPPIKWKVGVPPIRCFPRPWFLSVTFK